MIAQEDKYIRKAENATWKIDYASAINNYDKALELNKDSYEANAGKGIVLGEEMERYEQAIPYLEKALEHSPKDTLMTLNYTLGKCYHYLGEYKRAIYYYNKLIGYVEIGNEFFPKYLQKDIEDCNYALEHNKITNQQKLTIKNIGSDINTEFAEYVAIYTKNNALIFTSKRKDTPKEKINKWDGKYFESMYISKYENGKYSAPRRFTLPDFYGKSKFSKYNESSISLSLDGRSLFIYKGADIYIVDLNDSTTKPAKLDKEVNFNKYQNHASISKDNKTLYFSSESKYGFGGTDIYMSVKNAEGEWSKAQLLDSTINTFFNEDAPFISDDGTLYFSSTGHPGYGGYDIYKTKLENDHWTTPENLGHMINSPGNDIFFTLKTPSEGHFSSARECGRGDLDIYSIEYKEELIPECIPDAMPLSIIFKQDSLNHFLYTATVLVKPEYADRIISYSWKLNDEPMNFANKEFNYSFNKAGKYNFSVKIIGNFDNCQGLMAACTENSIDVIDTARNILASENGNKYLTDAELTDINWNSNPLYFDHNSFDLRPDVMALLDKKIEVLNNNNNLFITINGYADAVGDEKYNLQLSAKRANIVKQYLMNKGISLSRFKQVNGLGETNFVNNCDNTAECTEAQHRLNRRAEILIMR